MTTRKKPIPTTILTGFLGAGKTTLLNRILHADHGLRVAVMVNDFGSINIDSQLVVDVDADTVSLSNGCICCTIRGDLIGALLDLVRRPDPPEYILIEASGVSDPLEIALTFRNPELSSVVMVDSVLTIIDAEQVLSLERDNEVLAVLQVGAADIVIVNKADLVSADGLQKVKEWVRSIIKDARILEAVQADIPLELLLGVGQFDPARMANRESHEIHIHSGDETDHAHHDHSMIFDTWSWQSAQPLSFKATKRAIEKLPTSIYRAKGVLFLADDPDRRGILQVVGKRATLTWGPPWGSDLAYSQLVVIGSHGELDREALQATFDGCLAANTPGSEIGRLADSVLSWLRKR
jgi:G3E family GTPase